MVLIFPRCVIAAGSAFLMQSSKVALCWIYRAVHSFVFRHGTYKTGNVFFNGYFCILSPSTIL